MYSESWPRINTALGSPLTANLKQRETSSVIITYFTFKVIIVFVFHTFLYITVIFVTAVPGAPDKPTVSSVTRNSMTVNWEEPEYDGGSPVTGYWLEMKDTTSKRWKRVNRDPIKAMTLGVSYKVTGLIEGSDYQFRVYAINAAGVGPASLPSDPTTARDPIGKPSNHSFFSSSQKYYGKVKNNVYWFFPAPPGPPFPKVTDWTKSSADLEWSPPLKDGGSRVTGYIVEYKEEGKEEWEKVAKLGIMEIHCNLNLYSYSQSHLLPVFF